MKVEQSSKFVTVTFENVCGLEYETSSSLSVNRLEIQTLYKAKQFLIILYNTKFKVLLPNMILNDCLLGFI